jgi:hypothetical protein
MAVCWRNKYVGLTPSEMKRLRQLEEENGKLRGYLPLDEATLQDVVRRKVLKPAPKRQMADNVRSTWRIRIRRACRALPIEPIALPLLLPLSRAGSVDRTGQGDWRPSACATAISCVHDDLGRARRRSDEEEEILQRQKEQRDERQGHDRQIGRPKPQHPIECEGDRPPDREAVALVEYGSSGTRSTCRRQRPPIIGHVGFDFIQWFARRAVRLRRTLLFSAKRHCGLARNGIA